MRSDKYLWTEIVMPIYRQMYKEAKPSADIDELIKDGKTKTPNWFMSYFLDMERQREIIDEHCKRKKCRPRERKTVFTTICLGAAPNSSEETWKERYDKNNGK